MLNVDFPVFVISWLAEKVALRSSTSLPRTKEYQGRMLSMVKLVSGGGLTLGPTIDIRQATFTVNFLITYDALVAQM